MYPTHSSDRGVAVKRVQPLRVAARSLLSRVGVLGLRAIAKTASILATVIGKKVSETKTSFLEFEAANTWKRNDLFVYRSNKSPN